MRRPLRLLLADTLNRRNIVETSFPHLGLGHLASSLRLEWSSLDMKIVDWDTPKWLREFCPDLLCLTSVSQYYTEASRVARIATAQGIPVIIGGAHVSALPHTMTEDMAVGVLREGEETIVDLVRLWQDEGAFKPESLKTIPGIAYHDHGQIVQTAPRPLMPDLDYLPFPDRSLLPIRDHTNMFTSRGCPYRCIFCFSTRFWEKVRFNSADYVAEEMHLLKLHYKVDTISLLDDLFIANKRRLEEIIELLIRRNILGKLSYICCVRSNLVTEEMCQLLRTLRVKSVGIGVETACPTTLAYLKGRGNITVEDHARAIELLLKYNITPSVGLIIGAPEESREDILMTLDFINKYKIDTFAVNVLIPYPGTPLWDYAKGRGLVSDDMDWNRLAQTTSDFSPETIILSEKLTYRELSELYEKFINVRRRRYVRTKGMINQGMRHPLRAATYILRRL